MLGWIIWGLQCWIFSLSSFDLFLYFPSLIIILKFLSYLELALLPCWRFLHGYPESILQRLVEMMRGIADPVASAYCRLYLVQCAQRLPRHDTGSDSCSSLLIYNGMFLWCSLWVFGSLAPLLGQHLTRRKACRLILTLRNHELSGNVG